MVEIKELENYLHVGKEILTFLSSLSLPLSPIPSESPLPYPFPSSFPSFPSFSWMGEGACGGEREGGVHETMVMASRRAEGEIEGLIRELEEAEREREKIAGIVNEMVGGMEKERRRWEKELAEEREKRKRSEKREREKDKVIEDLKKQLFLQLEEGEGGKKRVEKTKFSYSPSLKKSKKNFITKPSSPSSSPSSPPLFSSLPSFSVQCGRCSLEIETREEGGEGEGRGESWKQCGVCGEVFCDHCWKLPLNKNPCSLGGGGHVGSCPLPSVFPSSPPLSPLKIKSPPRKITAFSSSSSTSSGSSSPYTPPPPSPPLSSTNTKSPSLKFKTFSKKKLPPLECTRCTLPIHPLPSSPPSSPSFGLNGRNRSVLRNRKEAHKAQKCLICGEWFCGSCQQLSAFKNSCSLGGCHIYEENGEGGVGGRGEGEGGVERGGSFSPTFSAFSLSPSFLYSFPSGSGGDEVIECGRCAIEVSVFFKTFSHIFFNFCLLSFSFFYFNSFSIF